MKFVMAGSQWGPGGCSAAFYHAPWHHGMGQVFQTIFTICSISARGPEDTAASEMKKRTSVGDMKQVNTHMHTCSHARTHPPTHPPQVTLPYVLCACERPLISFKPCKLRDSLKMTPILPKIHPNSTESSKNCVKTDFSLSHQWPLLL